MYYTQLVRNLLAQQTDQVVCQRLLDAFNQLTPSDMKLSLDRVNKTQFRKSLDVFLGSVKGFLCVKWHQQWKWWRTKDSATTQSWLVVVDGKVYLPLDTEYRLGTRASGISPAERVKTKDCISSRKRFLLPWWDVPVLGRSGREELCVQICLSLRHEMKYAMEYTIVVAKVPVCPVKRAVHLANSLVLWKQ